MTQTSGGVARAERSLVGCAAGRELPAASVAAVGSRFRTALAESLRDDPDRYGLRPAMSGGVERLIDTLAAVEQGSLLSADLPHDPDEREELFVRAVVDRVGSEHGLIVDSMVRRAAADVATAILDREPALRDRVRTGVTTSHALTDELLCFAYRLFLADAVTEFLAATIGAGLLATVPGLPVLDPTGALTRWLAEHIAAWIETPCERSAPDERRPVRDLLRDRAGDGIRQALGLDTAPTTEMP